MLNLGTELDQAVWDRIQALDLDCIKIKLMDSDEGEGWPRSRADQVEQLYKKFLLLTHVSSTPVVADRTVDKFWHTHILDTEKYARDCEHAFGCFLHHFPYFGMRGEADAEALQAGFEKTKKKYLEIFGEAYDRENAGYFCNTCCGQCRKIVEGDVDLDGRPAFAASS